MGDKSAIEWTQATWNPVTGCSRVSDGCRNCYAEALSLRYGWSKKPWTAVNAAENVVLHPERLEQPLHWRKPRMIFVNSMSDLFHERIPDAFLLTVFGIMRRAPQHTFQVLTKRPERVLDFTTGLLPRYLRAARHEGDVLPNVWLGTSVEAQREADLRIPLLLGTPAAVRFLSCEPLLGPINLTRYLGTYDDNCTEEHLEQHGWAYDEWSGGFIGTPRRGSIPYDPRCGLDWVIAGGESGPHYRPMNLDWARSLRDQCTAAGTAYFFKQVGGRTPKAGGRELDGRTWDQMPRREGVTHVAQE